MKLCIITSTFSTNSSDPIGGFILDFCLELTKHHDVSVITQKRAANYDIDKRINLIAFGWSGKNIPLSDLKFYKPSHVFHLLSLLINARKTINTFFKTNNIDHTFALWAIPSGIASYYLFKKKNIPYDIWCLGSDIWKHKNNGLTRRLLLKILKNATHVYADGFQFSKEIELLSKRTCDFLPSCRNIPKTDYQNNSKKTFIYIGRYHENKGPDILIDAISRLPEAISNNCNFVFYGTGLMKKKLIDISAAKELKNVFIHDIIDKNNIYEAISGSHFLIIPSRKDSIPVIFSDALQCNTPVIASDVGDLGKIVSKYNIGYTFEKENVSELCGMIIRAFDDKKENYCKNIIEAANLFSVENAVTEFEKNLNR